MDKATEQPTKKNERIKKEHPCTHEGCNAVFWKPSKLQYHSRRHTGERPFVCDEPNCNKSYLYSFHLRRHKEGHLKTTLEERITCPHKGCYLELANKYSLKKHIKRKHNPERNYRVICDVCKQGFFKKRQLVAHSYVHTGVLPYECERCHCRFSRLNELNRHMRTHTSYSCKCGEVFERWSILLQHKKICRKIGRICNICDRQFNKTSNLQRHLQVHMSDGSQKYHCGYDNCLRVYEHKKNLIYHINIYHKKTPKPRIYCGYQNCDQSFTRKQSLRLHIDRVHTGPKTVEVKQRRVRKDKGVRRMDVAAALVGFNLGTRQNDAVEKDASTSKGSLIEAVERELANKNCTNTI